MSNPETTLAFLVNGERYSVDLTDFDALEHRAFRLATGVKFSNSDELDELELIGALVWLVKRRENPRLAYDDVLKNISIDSVTEASEEVEAVPPSPPA